MQKFYRRQMIGLIVLALYALFASGIAIAADSKTLTLEKALELALSRNPSITASQSQVQAAQGRVTQARAGYLPNLSVSSSYNRKYSYSPDSSSSSNGNDYDDYLAKTSLSQLIYDFGATTGKIDSTISSLESSRKSLQDTAAGLYRDVKLTFLEALKKQQLVEVNRESLRVQEKHLAQARALYKNGMRPRIDVTKSETEVSQARLTLLQSEYAMRNSFTNLEALLGGSLGSQGYQGLAEVVIDLRPPEQLEPLTAQGLKKRPDMLQLKSQVQAAKAGLESVLGGYWPRLNATGSYTLSDDEPALEDNAWQAGVTLTWDIFTGFRHEGEKTEAQAEVDRLQALVKSKELAIVSEVTQSYLTVKEAYEAIEVARTALSQARENMKQAEGRYQAGRSNAVELSDAQVLYTQSQSALVQATYTHLQAWASLDYAVGTEPSIDSATWNK
ncbi:MAG: TolC family protein [Desulfarculaceae bacterium]|jgi:outer membrane protein